MKQSIRALKTPIQARMQIPGSKSITNRALILAALAEGISEISGILLSEDTYALIHALQRLGVSLQLDEKEHVCLITGCKGRFPARQASVWCADAGTVSRFLLAACAGSPGIFNFDASDQMRKRPLASLLQSLRAQGAKCLPEDARQMPFILMGCERLSGGEIEIDSAETSQFLSGLLMIAPYAASPMLIKTRELVSSPFVDMTCDMMAEFGVHVRRMSGNRFSVPAGQTYAGRAYAVEPDFSTASYFFAAAAVTGGEINIEGMQRSNSKQGDAQFLQLLENMGCNVTESPDGLKLQGPQELRGVHADMQNLSDTFMTLAALAPFANSPTLITNIAHTRLQESDRISAMCKGLQALQIKVEEGADWLKIYPGSPRAARIDSHRDHRIAMAFSIIGLRVPGIEIDDAECVAKTCPEFFKLWEGLSPFS